MIFVNRVYHEYRVMCVNSPVVFYLLVDLTQFTQGCPNMENSKYMYMATCRHSNIMLKNDE